MLCYTAVMTPINLIVDKATSYRPRKIWWRRIASRSAVAAVLDHRTELNEPAVLLMQRAIRQGDPWSGHISFPGGRAEAQDNHVYETAVRETYEEIGLNLITHGVDVGRLSDLAARPPSWKRRPMLITPFIFQLQQEPQWHLDPKEVASVFWVPLSFLADHNNRETMSWERGGITLNLPCYFYQEHRIWGLTLRMLDELISVIYP